MDGYILGSMIAANSIVGEQIQANSIKAANLEINVQKKIENATDTETVKALIKADLDGFESTLSKEFVTVENATTQIQQATEVAVKEATQSIVNNAVTESMGAVNGQLNDKLNQYTNGTLLPIVVEKAEEVLQDAENYVVTKLDSYATKSELKSSISQTRDQIELSVSEKYTTKSESATIITEAVDGITVGAINRVLGTGESKSFKFNGGANETWLPYKFSNDISNKEVYVSFKYTLTGTAQNGSQIEFAPSYLKKANNQTVYQPKNIFFASDRLQDVNISDTLSFVTRDFKDISPSSSSYIRFVGNGFTGTLSISELQIKPGNSKTSWSPAPEDTIADINDAKADAIASANNALITTIANYYTKEETESAIRVAKEEIDLGVSTKYETKGNVETKISSAKNQLNTEINKKANTTDVYFKTEVYTKDETNSRINIAKENITLAVSQDYETKASVETKISSTLNSAKSYADTKKTEAINSAASDATSKINSAKNELNTAIGKKANITDVYNKTEVYTKTEADSRITIAKEEINLGVKNTYETKANVETKITAINVGSTNLIQGTKDFVLDNSRIKGFYNTGNFTKSTDGGFTVMTSRTQSGLTTNNILGLFSSYAPCKKGDTFTVSFWMKVTDVRAWDIKKPHIWEVYDSGKTRIEYQDVDISSTNTNKPTVTNGQWVLMTSTHKVSSSNAAYCGVRLALFRNGCIAFKKPKIETGNKATDWSPAPEDISNNIATAKSEAIASANNTLSSTIANYYTKEQTDSSIRIAKEAIELGVSTNYETKANVETKVSTTLNNAKSYADTKKSEAINSANNALTTTIANYYTKEQTNSQINIAKEAINLGVSNTYETKANVETKINGVQIGGTNLVTDSHFDYDRNWSKGTGVTRVREGFDGGYCMKTVGALKATRNFHQGISIAKLEKGQQYTATVWIKTQDVVRGTTNPHLFFFASYQLNNKWVGECALSKAIPSGTTAWTKYVLTFTMPTIDFDIMTVEGYARDFTGTIWWDGIKLEKGNKATDWSPSPLDISTDITNAKTEAINTSSSDATNKVNSAKNELNTAINKKANSSDVYVKSEVYTKAQTDSAIKVAKDEINLGVSNTYETKANVETKINNISIGGDNLLRNGNFNYNLSNWTVSDMSSGGSNKSVNVVNGDASWRPLGKKTLEIKGTNTTNRYGVKSATMTLTPSTKYTISGYCAGHRVSKIQINIRDIDNNDANIFTKDLSPAGGGATLDKWYRFELTFTTTSNTKFAVNLYSVNFANDGYVWFNDVKVQQGTKATAWSPCAEDISNDITTAKADAIASANNTLSSTIANYYTKEQTDSSIRIAKEAIELGVSTNYETKANVETKVSSTLNNAKSYADTKKSEAISSANNTLNTTIANYYTKNQTDSQINVAKDSINLGVSQTYETKANVETKVNTTLNSAKSYADTKKSEAINSAATDAANKVNSAKSELNTAINKKANSADVYKKTEVYTKNETNSQITTAKNEINQSVSSTYETKTNVTTKLNNLSVSATNLLDNSAPLSTSGWSGWSSVSGLNTSMEVSTTDNSTHGKQGKITFSGSVTGNAGRHKSPVQKLTSGKTYSWSIWLRSGSGNLTVDVGQEQNGRREVSVGTSWTRFTHTYTANDNQYYAFIIRPKNVTSSHSLYFHSVMLVEGDKPVAWQTSPTEVLSDKTNIEQRMSSAESKITDTAITNTVKKNFYTKTETDNQITSKDYQTSSQVQQTVNSLQIKFTESGGYNLIRNSSGLNGTSSWTSTATLGTATSTNIGGACDKYMYLDNGTTTSEQFAYSSRFKLKPSTKYTLTGWFHNYTKCPSFDVFVLSSTSVDSSDTGTSYTNVHPLIQGQNTNGAWKKYTVSFTTPSGCKSGVVRIDNNGYNANGSNSNRVHWSALILTEGVLEVPWAPHPNEVYDGITTIDKNGIKVSTNKGAYTQFDSNGMTSYDNSGNQTLGIRNGGMAFYASNNHEYVGYISQSFTSAKERNGVVVGLSHYGDYLALGVSDDTDPNKGFYKPSWILLSRYDDKSENVNYGINMYQDLYMHDCSLRNSKIKYDGFKRSSSDYISFNITNQTSSSQLNLELADDSSTYFNIRANNYSDGNKYIARFNYAKGTEASNIGVHFYRAMNCHGYNITNVGNMSVYSLQSEDLEVNDIRITSPVAVASMNGRSTPTLSVVKSVDDVTEAHGIVTISNKKEKVELPLGLIFTDYYVQVTGNKVANLAVTERTDEYFIIETDSEEEIEVFYTIKAFQPNYVTRTAVYGELQGEDGTCVETYEESMEEE